MDFLLSRHFISIFLVLLFSIRLASQRNTRDKELRFFWLTVISCFLLILEDYAEAIASENPDLRVWRTFLSVAGYVLRSTATVGLVFVVCRQKGRSRMLWWIPCGINLLVCCTAFFTDIAFGFDENFAFYRGPLGYVAFVVPIFYLAVILVMTYRYYVDYRRRADRLILVSCAAFCLLSGLLDSAHGGVRLHEAILISSIFFYVFLRSYDVRRDALTSVLNRQSLYEDCEKLKRSICAAASLDMNGLKTINNTQGHQAGDEALQKIGRCLRNVSGHNVRAYRIGGDEFVILFLERDEERVRKTLEQVRKETVAAGYSVSCGYAMREENESTEDMIRRSDIRMFENKAQYYRDRRHDRRSGMRENAGAGQLPPEKRKSMEEATQPFAIYRFREHRVETLLMSDGFCRMFGYESREKAVHILNEEVYSDVHPDDRERLRGAMLRFAENQEELDVVYRARAGQENGWLVVHARGTHMHTGTEERIATVWYMDEGAYTEEENESGSMMTQALSRALHEESILNASHYDGLTGLPSLTWFFQLAEALKSQHTAEGGNAALIYIDLAGMKYFNHKYGFAEGDRLLKAFAEVLSRVFGRESCCHISADRYACGTEAEKAEEKLRLVFDEAAKINGGKTLPVRAGIYSTAIEDVSVTAAFDRAKIACGSLRSSDTSGWSWYRTELRDSIQRRQYLVSNIDRAIREKWIKAYYQPIVSSADGKVCDMEALARWEDPEEGFLGPTEFIPYLENTGVVQKLDLYILEQVLEKIRYEREHGTEPVPHSINLSRNDFENCDIVEEIRRRVDAAGVEHRLITVEITESVIGSNFEYMNGQIRRFREAGFAVWMDDFGSGYSSLDVLHSMEFDLIKFDMSFMRKLEEGENSRIILRELTKMATLLHLDTLCEGVEKEEHVQFLKEIGCSRMQGYYFGKPEPFMPKAEETECGNQREAYMEAISLGMKR